MPRRKINAPNDFCDPKADEVPQLFPSSTPSTTTRTSSSNPESSRSTTKSNPSSQFNTKSTKLGAKPPLTHFLCIPLVTSTSRPRLQEALERFKEDVCLTESVPEKAVRPVGTLHLTLGVMSLDEDALARATSMLQSLDLTDLFNTASSESNLSSALVPPMAHQPLVISLRGLHSMHSPASTSILYAAPHDPTNRLYPAAEHLRKMFTQAGFMVPDDRPLKLHATIINTIYAKAGKGGRGAGHGRNAKALVRLDAEDMVAQYEEFVWCEGLRVDRVSIWRMGAKPVVDAAGLIVGEEYEEVAALEV